MCWILEFSNYEAGEGTISQVGIWVWMVLVVRILVGSEGWILVCLNWIVLAIADF